MATKTRLSTLLSLLIFAASVASGRSLVTTGPGTGTVSLAVEGNSTVVSLAYWTHTAAIINITVLAQYPYLAHTTVNITHLWHFLFIYQPVNNRTVQIHHPLAQTYVNMNHHPVTSLQVSSDALVYWSLCLNAYACELASPEQERTGREETGVVVVVLGVVAALLAVALVTVLALVWHRKKSLFHIYDKPFWPPQAPPLPPREFDGVQGKTGKGVSVEGDPPSCDTDHHSVNSLYGLVLPRV